MASLVSTGSPRQSRRNTPTIKVFDDDNGDDASPTSRAAPRSQASVSGGNSPVPLNTTNLANLQSTKRQDKLTVPEAPSMSTGMEDILARLRINDSRKITPTQAAAHRAGQENGNLDKLLTRISNPSKAVKITAPAAPQTISSVNQKVIDGSSGSDRATTDSYGVISSSETSEISSAETAAILRMKQELAAAKSVITRQEQELAESRNFKHTMDQAMGPPSEIDFSGPNDISELTIGHLQSAFNATARPFTSGRKAGWHAQDDTRSEQSDFSAGSFPPRAIWNNQNAAGGVGIPDLTHTAGMIGNSRDARLSGQAHAGMYGSQPSIDSSLGASRVFSGSSSSGLGYDAAGASGMSLFGTNLTARRDIPYRSNSTLSDVLTSFGSLPGISGMTSPPLSPLDAPGPYGLGQRGLGVQPSPITPGFPAAGVQGLGSPWPMNNSVNQTYVTTLEPMNYRRLLDKSVSCDWKYIVDKIVCNNDQQASIFLQQKLKVGTAEQKYEIVEAIVNQAYPLMINRFGNFLVQRCFEHGTPEQVVAIANAIHGNVIALSMDPFGCHVIQKGFDSVPECHKADMVRELLRRIPDTVIHRYACHVWQKLFELRWSGEPPQIMLKVNEALRGMWHEVALGETGSLVVQNIFENCVEEEKLPAIEEVITNIDLIAHGQFGNWCIQHLCEHGSPPDKRRVIDHILTNSYNYSIDQFASKVVEKCLKISGHEFLDRYLGVITTARPDRPRIPLIDIAGDQYGNYLIQWILMNSHQHQREQVAVHIRKHMVSLRGSKFGSRVAMLCCNPNSVTRPGPGAIVNPYGAPGQPARNQWPRYR